MFNPTIMTSVVEGIQSDRRKEAEQFRFLSAIKSASKAKSPKKDSWWITLPSALTSRPDKLWRPAQTNSC